MLNSELSLQFEDQEGQDRARQGAWVEEQPVPSCEEPGLVTTRLQLKAEGHAG